MDLEEWEFLPNDHGFIDLVDDDDDHKTIHVHRRNPSSKSLFKMNHFPPIPLPPNQLIPIKINLEPPPSPPQPPPTIHINTNPSPEAPPKSITETESVSQQVFFKKETEFVDMKMDSPRSTAAATTTNSMVISSPRKTETMNMVDCGGDDDHIVKEEDVTSNGNGGLSIWRRGLTGIGAICSFGVVAATICVIILGSNQKNKHQQHNQKRKFHIYTDDKRIQHVVQQATKMNEAIYALRGGPIVGAHISFGGYYNGV